MEQFLAVLAIVAPIATLLWLLNEIRGELFLIRHQVERFNDNHEKALAEDEYGFD